MSSDRFTVTKATEPIAGSVSYGAAGNEAVPAVKIHDSSGKRRVPYLSLDLNVDLSVAD